MSKDTARLAAVETFYRAVTAGAEYETAMEVALAKMRRAYPKAPDFKIRAHLAKRVAAERAALLPSLSRRVH